MDLLTVSHHSLEPTDVYRPLTCVGAYVLDQTTGKIFSLLAKETILATGGLGSVFLHTTNPPGARGDGIAMAYRAGARCINMQYIQFHPTALLAPDGCFLISETVRGEGGRLVDRHGKEFMQRFHPDGSLAPRDIAARAIYQTMLESGEPCVYLDITHKPADQLRERFPGIYAVCMERGIDLTREPIPVVPAAHYSCGGIATDDCGRTTVDRLRAVGEVACTGLHGANRLASTSLLECLVWGTRAGAHAAEGITRGDDFYFPKVADWRYEHEPADPALISAGLADHPAHDVELCRPDPQRETSESGHADFARTRSGDRAFLRKVRGQRFHHRPAQRHPHRVADPRSRANNPAKAAAAITASTKRPIPDTPPLQGRLM